MPPKTAPAATATPPPGTNADTGWPRTIALNSGTAVWYQPQIESWTDQKKIVAWSAVSFHPTGAKEPALGTIKIEGDTQVAVDDRVVRLDLKHHRVQLQDAGAEHREVAGQPTSRRCPQNQRVLDLDRLLAYIADSPLKVKDTEGIKADPPIVFSAAAPAMLINLDGDPIWSPIKDVDLRYALNTNWDLFEHQPSKTLYLRIQRVVAAGAERDRAVDRGDRQAARQLLQAAGRRQLEGRQGGPAGQEAQRQDDAEGVRQHGAGRAHPARGADQLRVGSRGAVPALGEQHRSRRVPDGPRRRLLLPRRRPLVQRAEPRRPLDLCHAEAAGGLQEDPDRASALARAGVGAGHAAGHRGRGAGHAFHGPRG